MGESYTYEELEGHSHLFEPFQPLLDANIDMHCGGSGSAYSMATQYRSFIVWFGCIQQLPLY